MRAGVVEGLDEAGHNLHDILVTEGHHIVRFTVPYQDMAVVREPFAAVTQRKTSPHQTSKMVRLALHVLASVLFLCLVSVSSPCAETPVHSENQTDTRTIQVDGFERSYLVHVPGGPVVMMLHGRGGTSVSAAHDFGAVSRGTRPRQCHRLDTPAERAAISMPR